MYIFPPTEIRNTGHSHLLATRPNRHKLYPQIKTSQNQTDRMRHLNPQYPQVPSVQRHILKSRRSSASSEQKAGIPLPRPIHSGMQLVGKTSHQLHLITRNLEPNGKGSLSDTLIKQVGHLS